MPDEEHLDERGDLVGPDGLYTTGYTPQDVRHVPFHEAELVAARLSDGQVYVTVKSLTDSFGVSQATLHNRLRRKRNYFAQYICKIWIPTSGGNQLQVCLNITAVPLFISGTGLDSIKDAEARARMEAYLDECMDVLAEHFGVSERGEMRVLRETMSRMVIESEAEAQDFQRTKDELKRYIDEQIGGLRADHQRKVAEIRQAFAGVREDYRSISAGGDAVTPQQLDTIKSTVHVLAAQVRQHDPLFTDPHKSIYGHIWRISGVGSTDRIKRKDYEAVMRWMESELTLFYRFSELTEAQRASVIADLRRW